jgi:hypothetical protein
MASSENVCFEWFELCEREKAESQRAHARINSLVWIISGIYLFMMSPAASLRSLSAVEFFTVGIFVAAGTIAAASCWLRQRAADVFIETDAIPDPAAVLAATALSLLLWIAEVGAVYGGARAAFGSITGM